MQSLADVNDVSGKTFDFVIIGGGVAGCVLANRLSKNPDVSVALLEAGNAHFDDPFISDPMGWRRQMFNPEYDWIFRTKPQEKVKNGGATPSPSPDPSFYWSRGKGLGGSSCINYLYWTKPQREEVDAIEKLGNVGWNWERFSEASKRSEQMHPNKLTNDPEYSPSYTDQSVGHEGPVHLTFNRTCSRAEVPVQKALSEYGVKTLNDGLGGTINGAFRVPNNVDPETETRSSAATAYLVPVLHRPNLKVLTGAYVTNIINSKNNGGVSVATAVEFEHSGVSHSVSVRRDAILSAGTIKSPHILELSGIGDGKLLASLGVPVQVDLPAVGTNLQDHLLLTGSRFRMRSDKQIVTTDTLAHPDIQKHLRDVFGGLDKRNWITASGVAFVPLQDFSPRAEELISGLERRLSERPSASSPGHEEILQVQLDMIKDKNIPDLEILVFPFNSRPDGLGRPYISLFVSIGHPISRGTIHATSKDAKVQPEIDPNYIEDEFDLELLLDGMKFIRKLAATDAWREISEEEVMPGKDVKTDEELRDFIRKEVFTSWHSCGTCSMLPKEKGGVVDTSLKVYGTTNIRVVDLSILPLITAVHTQATVYAIAEQAADIIMADHGIEVSCS